MRRFWTMLRNGKCKEKGKRAREDVVREVSGRGEESGEERRVGRVHR